MSASTAVVGTACSSGVDLSVCCRRSAEQPWYPPLHPPPAPVYFNRTYTLPILQVVHEMEQAGVEPNSYTFTALLNCLARRRKTFDGFQARLRLPPAADYVLQ